MVISYRICTEIFKQLCDVVNPEGYEIMKVSIKDRNFFLGSTLTFYCAIVWTDFCIGPISVSDQLRTYPFPSPTLSLSCNQLTVFGFGEG